MLRERCAQSFKRKRSEKRQPAQMPGLTHLADNPLGLGIFVADKRYTQQRNIARAQSLDRQQTMIDGAQRGACAQHDRRTPLPMTSI